jgi:hypothetical protein
VRLPDRRFWPAQDCVYIIICHSMLSYEELAVITSSTEGHHDKFTVQMIKKVIQTVARMARIGTIK